MSWSAEVRKQPAEFVSVVQCVNGYLAIHTKENKRTAVSQHPETDKKIAEAAAKLFAQTNNIPYVISLKEAEQTIITVLKRDNEWFPAILLPDKIALITDKESTSSSLGKNYEEAVLKANLLAHKVGGVFMQSPGMLLGNELI